MKTRLCSDVPCVLQSHIWCRISHGYKSAIKIPPTTVVIKSTKMYEYMQVHVHNVQCD